MALAADLFHFIPLHRPAGLGRERGKIFGPDGQRRLKLPGQPFSHIMGRFHSSEPDIWQDAQVGPRKSTPADQVPGADVQLYSSPNAA